MSVTATRTALRAEPGTDNSSQLLWVSTGLRIAGRAENIGMYRSWFSR